MGKRCRKASVVVLAAAVVAPVASGVAAVTQRSTVPAKLVGTWTRKVTSADVTRAGAPGVPAGTVCTLTVKKGGLANASVFCTKGVGVISGQIVSAGMNRVHLNLPTAGNVYRWRVSGRLLTLTKISDPVQDRVAVFWGVWKRK